ncbi:DUF6864 domain-containing function [Prevotella sp.]|jgi:hypothetical protein|uniref:DUF6864 domain-containing function n=1 Tax=Prevotella sp. TaxID=59823 RepID=UPI003AB50A23
MDIFVDKYYVYDSGILVLSSDKTITMKIEDADFIIDFKNTDEGTTNMRLVESDDSRCHVTFENFNNPLGISIKEPILIATLDNGDSLYLQYAITTLNKAVKVFQYTLYTTKNNGK